MCCAVFYIFLGDDLAVLEEEEKTMHIVPICRMRKNWVEGLHLLFVWDHLTLFLPKAKLKAENMSEVAGGGESRRNTFFSSLFFEVFIAYRLW